MGYLNIPLFNLMSNLGITVIEAPPITKKTVELGSLYSPEGVCLPYKITMGNFIESIDKGADTLITVCGSGKCRLGFYNAVQKIALSEKVPLQMHTLNISENILSNFYRLLHTLAPKASSVSIIKNIVMSIKILRTLDSINSAKNRYGCQTDNTDILLATYSKGIEQLGKCHTFREINETYELILHRMNCATQKPNYSPIKIGLIGEFYMLLEPYVNYRLEDFLIKEGVEIKKFVYTGDWAYSHTLLHSLGLYNEEKAYLKEARPYLNYHVGGDGLKSVGSALWCAQNQFDGIIHVYPFGCVPEIVAQYALKNIARDYHIPMLSLSIDEHASNVGITTRLEAFVDCLKRKPK